MMEKLLSDLKGHSSAWPFQEPVNEKDVVDYYLHISHPMGASSPSPSPFLSSFPQSFPTGATDFACRPGHDGAQAGHESVP